MPIEFITFNQQQRRFSNPSVEPRRNKFWCWGSRSTVQIKKQKEQLVTNGSVGSLKVPSELSKGSSETALEDREIIKKFKPILQNQFQKSK